jgi:hypothetical protein
MRDTPSAKGSHANGFKPFGSAFLSASGLGEATAFSADIRRNKLRTCTVPHIFFVVKKRRSSKFLEETEHEKAPMLAHGGFGAAHAVMPTLNG